MPRTIRLHQNSCLTSKRFETFCIENNSEPIYAHATYYRAIGLVECLIQTIKRQLSCMKAHSSKQFNLEHSINSFIPRLRKSKPKPKKITPFETHLGQTMLYANF